MDRPPERSELIGPPTDGSVPRPVLDAGITDPRDSPVAVTDPYHAVRGDS